MTRWTLDSGVHISYFHIPAFFYKIERKDEVRMLYRSSFFAAVSGEVGPSKIMAALQIFPL